MPSYDDFRNIVKKVKKRLHPGTIIPDWWWHVLEAVNSIGDEIDHAEADAKREAARNARILGRKREAIAAKRKVFREGISFSYDTTGNPREG